MPRLMKAPKPELNRFMMSLWRCSIASIKASVTQLYRELFWLPKQGLPCFVVLHAMASRRSMNISETASNRIMFCVVLWFALFCERFGAKQDHSEPRFLSIIGIGGFRKVIFRQSWLGGWPHEKGGHHLSVLSVEVWRGFALENINSLFFWCLSKQSTPIKAV